MAARTTPLDTTAGSVLLALARRCRSSTNGYRACRQSQANAQIASPVALALVLSRCAYCTDAFWLLCVPCAWLCREADRHAVGRQGRMGLNTVYSADAHNVTVIGKIQFASKMRQVVFRSDNTPPL